MRRLSGSLCHISVIRTRSEQTSRPTGFPKNNETRSVSVDRNSSMGGVVVGNPGAGLGLPWALAGIGAASVPVSHFGED